MDKIEQLREQIHADGWTIKEISLYDDEPYNGGIIGWRVDGCRCKEKLVVQHNTLQEALELFISAKGQRANA
jgi:hypothetical protein